MIVQASGKVCDDKLDIRLELDGSTIVASGRGVVPDNEFGYCDRYIDTGGEGRSEHDESASIRLDPGTYSVRTDDGADEIEFKLDAGVITSSFPYATLAEAADVASERTALSPAREATIAVANEINRSLERVEPGRYAKVVAALHPLPAKPDRTGGQATRFAGMVINYRPECGRSRNHDRCRDDASWRA